MAPQSVVVGCLSLSPRCSYLIMISMNEFCKYSCSQSSTLLASPNSLSFNTCYFDCWLRIEKTTTTLTSTLSCLGDLGVLAIVELIVLVLNMFFTLVFLGHSPFICSSFEHSIQGYWICILMGFIGHDLVFVTCYAYLIVAIGTTSTSFI
jgi:hypothetical protein